MCWKKNLARSSWLMVGVGVMGVSLLGGQKQTVWGSPAKQDFIVRNEDVFTKGLLDTNIRGMEELPEENILPGDWLYPFKVTHDWLWWNLADSDTLKARRQLQLGNERLMAGWELSKEGELEEAVKTLVKAEGYLSMATEGNGGFWMEEWNDSIRLHYGTLMELERIMPEDLKPRITELMNVSRLAMEARQIKY